MGGRAGGGAGMGSGSRGLASKIRGIESSIRNLDVEHSYVLDSKGNIVEHNIGGNTEVMSAHQDPEFFASKGITMTHNHPEDKSFSANDVSFGVRTNANEIRATSKEHTYSLKPGKKGWGIPRGDLGAFKVHADYATHLNAYRKKTLSQLSNAMKAKDTATIKKIFAGEQHYAMKALAKQYGWTYKVTKN
jgi:hypothetical protein